jgi:hypothetical protein
VFPRQRGGCPSGQAKAGPSGRNDPGAPDMAPLSRPGASSSPLPARGCCRGLSRSPPHSRPIRSICATRPSSPTRSFRAPRPSSRRKSCPASLGAVAYRAHDCLTALPFPARRAIPSCARLPVNVQPVIPPGCGKCARSPVNFPAQWTSARAGCSCAAALAQLRSCNRGSKARVSVRPSTFGLPIPVRPGTSSRAAGHIRRPGPRAAARAISVRPRSFPRGKRSASRLAARG